MSTDVANSRPFSITLRIYYQHTDAGGVVYHANYLSFMEAARTELLHLHGFDLAELAGRLGVIFIVHRAELSFQRPARLHDLLTVTASPALVGRARIGFLQEVFCREERLVSATIDLACVDPRTWRPAAVPEAVRICMLKLERAGERMSPRKVRRDRAGSSEPRRFGSAEKGVAG